MTIEVLRCGVPKRAIAGIVVVWCAWATVALAQTPPGREFQVNTYTTEDQFSPEVAMDVGGSFVVVWTADYYGSGGSDTTSFSVQGRRFASDGAPFGADFQVNSFITGGQRDPAVAADAGGAFVVVWTSAGSSGTDTVGDSVQGQRYSADGTPQGGEFQVNTYTNGSQWYPAVAAEADGDFVVVWQGYEPGGDGIFGQRFDSGGAPRGGEFQVFNNTGGPRFDAAVAVAADGEFVVVWTSRTTAGGDIYGYSIQARRYASDGMPLAGQFQVNSYTPNSQRYPSVALDAAGNFVVVWTSRDQDGDYYGIFGQRYNSDGQPEGGEFQINTYTTDSQYRPRVEMSDAGSFVVVWHEPCNRGCFGVDGQDGSGQGLIGRRFESDGTFSGGEFQIPTYTTSDQQNVSLAMGADGNFAVVWTSSGSSGTDTSGFSIQGKRLVSCFTDVDCDDGLFCNGTETCDSGNSGFCQAGSDPCAPPLACHEASDSCLAAEIFEDGFETGDTSAWSSSVP
ncbi:MAG: hypothetical protein GY953_03645 [bacterium]|nr:hypothetical protein [bacterium]